MVDWIEYIEGSSITMQYITSLVEEHRIGVIISCSESKGNFGLYPKCVVEINGRQKYWNMNQQSAKAFGQNYGTDDAAWIGKKVKFTIGESSKKVPLVVGIPIQ